MLFRPRATTVDTDVSFGGSEMDSDSDFSFAFNNSNFSDRLLKIEIVRDLLTDANGWTTIGDWARNRKRRREEIKKENVVRVFMQREEQIVNCDMLDTDYGVACENQEEEATTMVEELPSDMRLNFNQDGDEAAQSSNSSWNIGGSTILRVKMIHISSPILAAKSPFFYKLFSNETKESENRLVTLRIHASEETAFLDLLHFIYGNALSANCPTALLDLLLVADKFEVASCMRHCSILLRSYSMTCESALLYLDLPYSVLMAKEVLPLADIAKQFLGAHYKDISKFQEEVLNLPLAGIEAVLSNDDLLVASEDVVCEFVLKWARAHYHNLEERKEVLSSRLAHLIRFPFMSCRKLKKVLVCSDFDPELASKLVLEALFFKAEPPYRQSCLAVEATNAKTTNRHFVERAYKYRPIKVVEFEHPRQQRIVFLELKREECARLFPAGRVYSQAFHFGGQVFFLSAHCNMDQQSSFHCFGLFLGMQERKSVTFSVDYEFSTRVKPTEEYVSKYKGNYTFTGGKAVGYRNLFGIPWTSLMADDNLYFINGILHLKAELTVKQ